MNNKEISVIIPCLNEERTIVSCIKKCIKSFEMLGVEGEVIVSDNGSTDNTVKLSQEAGARVVFCEKKGYGINLQNGFASAEGKYLVMGDADDTYDFLAIPEFYKSIKEKDSDMVIGSRLRGKIEKGAMPFLNRYLGTPVLTALINILYGTKISDINCGLRMFKKETYDSLTFKADGMEFASELVIEFQLNKKKITEIPTSLAKDVEGRRPHLRMFRDGFRHLKLILMKRFTSL